MTNYLVKDYLCTLDKEEQSIEIIKVPKKRKQQVDKAAEITAKKISKKYKSIRFQ